MFSTPAFLLRHTRGVVFCLLFCMGMAIASPLVKPKSIALVCSGANGFVLVDIGTDRKAADLLVMTLDCADCLPIVLPPSDITICSAKQPLQGRIVVPKPSWVPDAYCLSPPSRGPPTTVFPT
ncbi:hypothetical protein [Rhodoferax sp. BLA1]|uniref:hypothetical protein n=1 Tax=Rhodoferax sp. BLA1 TaxID=2576062 RepID=UPI0015D20C6D|nr:hypothetical protein [Rhodoferax sp. BLA1]